MTLTPEPQDFETLRRSAIEFAQAASGNIWTDFNLHDPGVTLLEQTCFALSEVSFQATHTDEELLTDNKGDIRFGALSLFLPKETLPGKPVTLLDLAATLGEVEGVARVLVSRGPRIGLFNTVIIPARAEPGIDPKAQEAHVRERVNKAFKAHRPLGCDLHVLHVARRASARLAGDVKITGTAIPERVAAEIYYHISAILRGQDVGHQTRAGATRRIVFDDTLRFLHAPFDQDTKEPNLEDHLDRLRDIPGIADISTLSLTRRDFPLPQGEESAEAYYLDLNLPESLADIDLELTLDGVPLTLDPSQILEEFVHVSADHIARAQHHLDAKDWLPPKAGQRRSFALADVDALLPNVYRASAQTSPEAGLLVRYRSALNTHLSDMSASLRDLPTTLTALTDATSEDPSIQRQRVRLLDYLIAHQGEEMPPIHHAGLHLYRSAGERALFEMRWRLDFLEALPFLNRARGTGPDGNLPGAFLDKFLLLADLKRNPQNELAQNMTGLRIATEVSFDGAAPDFPRSELKLPDDPFDMLVRHKPKAQSLSVEELKEASPWIADDVCAADAFRRSADPKSFLVSQLADDSFAVFFDAGHPTHLYSCASFNTFDAAAGFTQKLRASWRALNERAEGAYLVEDILLRNAGSDFTPNVATMVLTGWTARTKQATYRAYVERLLEGLSPAHLLMRPLWMSQDEMANFEALHLQYLEGDNDAKRALRGLLADRMTQQ